MAKSRKKRASDPFQALLTPFLEAKNATQIEKAREKCNQFIRDAQIDQKTRQIWRAKYVRAFVDAHRRVKLDTGPIVPARII